MHLFSRIYRGFALLPRFNARYYPSDSRCIAKTAVSHRQREYPLSCAAGFPIRNALQCMRFCLIIPYTAYCPTAFPPSRDQNVYNSASLNRHAPSSLSPPTFLLFNPSILSVIFFFCVAVFFSVQSLGPGWKSAPLRLQLEMAFRYDQERLHRAR